MIKCSTPLSMFSTITFSRFVNSRLRFLESEATMFENPNKFAAQMPQILINILPHTCHKIFYRYWKISKVFCNIHATEFLLNLICLQQIMRHDSCRFRHSPHIQFGLESHNIFIDNCFLATCFVSKIFFILKLRNQRKNVNIFLKVMIISHFKRS
jgi:hypothetical protein